MIKLLKQYPLIGMIVGALGISFLFCAIYMTSFKGQIQLATLQADEKEIGEAIVSDALPLNVENVENEGKVQAFSDAGDERQLEMPMAENEKILRPTLVPIYICGEINSPGVYYVASDAIINDVLALCGGFTNQADVKAVNLASPIIPNEKIIIPKEGEEIDKLVESYDNMNERQDAISSRAQAPINAYGQDASAIRKETNSCININSANKETLMSLPGIGEVKANAIIAYREEHGGFTDKEELTNVSGIGDKTYEKLSQLITVE